MNINEFFKSLVNPFEVPHNKFWLYSIDNGCSIGWDEQHKVVYVTESTDMNKNECSVSTNEITVSFNVSGKLINPGSSVNGTYHVLKCRSNSQFDIELFLSVCYSTIRNEISEDDLLKTISTLTEMLGKRTELSDSELQGLYAELYTIKHFKDHFQLGEHWQSKNKMNFDFSITPSLKIEVKSTLKTTRIHRFQHEQLTNPELDVYVLSYMLRADDRGLNLKDLIIECLTIIDPQKLQSSRLRKILIDISAERLQSFSYEEEYTRSNLFAFRADVIPSFKDSREDIFNAEYDCILDIKHATPTNDFIDMITASIESSKV